MKTHLFEVGWSLQQLISQANKQKRNALYSCSFLSDYFLSPSVTSSISLSPHIYSSYYSQPVADPRQIRDRQDSLRVGGGGQYDFCYAFFMSGFILLQACCTSHDMKRRQTFRILNPRTLRQTHVFVLWGDIHLTGIEEKDTSSVIQVHATDYI